MQNALSDRKRDLSQTETVNKIPDSKIIRITFKLKRNFSTKSFCNHSTRTTVCFDMTSYLTSANSCSFGLEILYTLIFLSWAASGN